ncbi:MAG TPA: hypothetical protein VIY26_06445 [Acidimicrobiales bacterium]
MPHAHGAHGADAAPAAHNRAHCTPGLRALSYRFVVCCDDASLGTYVSGLLRSLRSGDEVDSGDVARYEVSSSSSSSSSRPGCVDVHRDGEIVVLDVPPGDAVATLVWDINRLAAERSGEYLLFHSGGLEAAGGAGLLVPAASGSGKSTLTAGLAQAGLGYLSDELVALELDGAAPGRLLPYPKPITVKPGSFTALASLDPGPFGDGWFGESSDVAGVGAGAGGDQAEWQVPVGEGTGRQVGSPCRPAYVIVPRYDAGAETALTRLSETEAFFSLALHAVNMLPHGADATAALGRLAADCECYALAMSDLDAACALVLGLVGARV